MFSSDNFPGIKDRAYVISFYDKGTKGTHLVSLIIIIDRNTTVYFWFFGTE